MRLCSNRLEASSGPLAEGVPKTIRGDEDQGIVNSEEVPFR